MNDAFWIGVYPGHDRGDARAHGRSAPDGVRSSAVKASDYIAAFLAENGVTTVFEMTGGMITFLLDSIRCP